MLSNATKNNLHLLPQLCMWHCSALHCVLLLFVDEGFFQQAMLKKGQYFRVHIADPFRARCSHFTIQAFLDFRGLDFRNF